MYCLALVKDHIPGGVEVAKICLAIEGHECICAAWQHSLLDVRIPIPPRVGGERAVNRSAI